MRGPNNRSGDVYTSRLRENLESHMGGTYIDSGHQTQIYTDNYRVSRDFYGDWHWTNQNLPKGHPARHKKPFDSRI
jgi:hypothetical protein